MEILITLTDTEYNALSRVCADPQEWAENAVKERARVAIEDIVTEQVRVMIANPDIVSIPASVDEIVANAPEPVSDQSAIENVTVIDEPVVQEPTATITN